jgi:hypothetical protein
MPITSHQAQAVIEGAAAKALELGLPVIVAVLDAGAHLKAFRRTRSIGISQTGPASPMPALFHSTSKSQDCAWEMS